MIPGRNINVIQNGYKSRVISPKLGAVACILHNSSPNSMDRMMENLVITEEEEEDLVVDDTIVSNVFNLPVGCFLETVGERLGNFIGRFLLYDDSNKGAVWKNYMRIRVEVDVLLPLKRGKNIRMSNGVSTRAEFNMRGQIFSASFVASLIIRRACATSCMTPQGDRWLKTKSGDEQAAEGSPMGGCHASQDRDVGGGLAGKEELVSTVNGEHSAGIHHLDVILSSKNINYNPVYEETDNDTEEDLGANLLDLRKRKRQNVKQGLLMILH
ncbi:hypothetical protein ACS0TY_021887 [Phlomoides rotata]